MLPSNMKQLILSGGGDEDEAEAVNRFYISLLPARPKILYLPVAWKTGVFDGCREWFSGFLQKHGVEDFTIWTDVAGKTIEDLSPFDSIYIGGGNTFKLLHVFREGGLIAPLREYIQSGKPVFGGSAGAIIFGADISTAGFGVDADENEVRMTDFSGLNEVSGHTVQCHYVPDQDSDITQWINTRGIPVISLGNAGGIYVTGEGIRALGNGAVLFDAAGRKSQIAF